MIKQWDSIKSRCLHFSRRLQNSQKGNVLVLTGILMPAVIGAAGVGTDTAIMFLWKRQLQAAADSGALTGAYSISQGFSSVQSVVTSDIAKNGTFPGQTTTVNKPPSSGAYTGDTNAVEVVLTTTKSLPFSSFFVDSPPVIQARAVARLIPGTGESCVISLDKSGSKALEFGGTADVTLGCGIASNSRANDAIAVYGNARVEGSSAAAVGGISVSGSGTLTTPIRQSYAPPQVDPFANLAVPSSPASCTYNNTKVKPNESVNLSPGRYCGGLDLKGNVNFAPGVYVIDGSTFSANSSATLSGSGVTFILTGSGNNYANIDINGGANLNLSAPTTSSGSPYTGVLFYQDRNAPVNASTTSNKINGNAGMFLQGAVYFPNQGLDISGGATGTTTCLKMVGYRVSFSGSSNISNVCPANSGVKPVYTTTVALVE